MKEEAAYLMVTRKQGEKERAKFLTFSHEAPSLLPNGVEAQKCECKPTMARISAEFTPKTMAIEGEKI